MDRDMQGMIAYWKHCRAMDEEEKAEILSELTDAVSRAERIHTYVDSQYFLSRYMLSNPRLVALAVMKDLEQLNERKEKENAYVF